MMKILQMFTLQSTAGLLLLISILAFNESMEGICWDLMTVFLIQLGFLMMYLGLQNKIKVKSSRTGHREVFQKIEHNLDRWRNMDIEIQDLG